MACPSVVAVIIAFLLLLLSTSCQAHNNDHHNHNHNDNNNKATLTIFDFTSWSYRAEIATLFGQDNFHATSSNAAYHSTLMVPPQNYSTLCEIPEHLQELVEQKVTNENGQDSNTNNATNALLPPSASASASTLPWRFPGSVSLLVSLGGDCAPEQKVQVALWLHQFISSDLKFVVLYNTEGSNHDAIVPLDVSIAMNNDEDNDVFGSGNDNDNSNTTDTDHTMAAHQDLQQQLQESGLVSVWNMG